MLLNAFRRLRHSRGFGIHSPSAYSFIRDTLCPSRRYAYYSYWSIPRRVASLDGRMLLRVIAALQPATIIVAGSDRQLQEISSIASFACPSAMTRRSHASTDDCDLLVCCDSVTATPQSWRHGIFARRHHPALEARVASATIGHLFRGRRAAIFVGTQAPYQLIDVPI